MCDRPLSWLHSAVPDNHATLRRLVDLLLKLPGSSGVKSVKQLLDTSPFQLANLLDVSLNEAKSLVTLASEATAPEYHNVLHLKQQMEQREHVYLCTGVPTLDTALRGGLQRGYVTEVVGRAGAGKTQFCLTLSVLITMLGKGVIYIDTENKFKPERVFEIGASRGVQQQTLQELAERITVLRPARSEQLLNMLNSLEEMMISGKVQLLVLDSVAALVRLDFATRTHIIARQQMLSKQAAQLKYLASTFNIPVVVTNQVTSTESMNKMFAMQTAEGVQVAATVSEPSYVSLNPALGNTWAHCVNVRILIELFAHSQSLRRVRIVKSPSCSSSSVYVDITAQGIVESTRQSTARKEQQFLESLSKEQLSQLLDS